MVINGFDRISAPADFVRPAPADTLLAGFLDDLDHGCLYIKDISYIGKDERVPPFHPWMDDDASGFGDCYGNYRKHRLSPERAFRLSGSARAAILKTSLLPFVSCSDEAVESGQVVLNYYHDTTTLFSARVPDQDRAEAE